MVTPDGQPVTFSKFDSIVLSLCARLKSEGVREGQSVVVLVDNNSVKLTMWMAMMRLGVVPAVLSNIKQLQKADLAVDWVIALPDQEVEHPQCLRFTQDWMQTPVDDVSEMPEPAMILSSSGTTGTPKFMRYLPGAFSARNGQMNVVGGEPQGHALIAISFHTVAAIRYAMRVMARGFGAVMPAPDARQSLERCVEFGVSEIVAPPPILADMVDAVTPELRVRLAINRIETVGASISQHLLIRTEGTFEAQVCVMYGSAEVGTITACFPLHEGYEPGLVGRASAGVSIRILDPDGAMLPQGETGRISALIPPDARIEPYLNAQGPFDDEGWFVTGDVGHLRDDGLLVLSGRANDLINVGGSGHLPDQFEALALLVPGVARVAAFGVQGPDGYDHVALAVVETEGFSPDLMRNSLSGTFKDVRVFDIHVVADLPTNAAGKIDRAALRARLYQV